MVVWEHALGRTSGNTAIPGCPVAARHTADRCFIAEGSKVRASSFGVQRGPSWCPGGTLSHPLMAGPSRDSQISPRVPIPLQGSTILTCLPHDHTTQMGFAVIPIHRGHLSLSLPGVILSLCRAPGLPGRGAFRSSSAPAGPPGSPCSQDSAWARLRAPRRHGGRTAGPAGRHPLWLRRRQAEEGEWGQQGCCGQDRAAGTELRPCSSSGIWCPNHRWCCLGTAGCGGSRVDLGLSHQQLSPGEGLQAGLTRPSLPVPLPRDAHRLPLPSKPEWNGQPCGQTCGFEGYVWAGWHLLDCTAIP